MISQRVRLYTLMRKSTRQENKMNTKIKKLLASTLLFSLFSTAQATVYLPYDEIDAINDYFVVYKDNQSGVMDKKGQLISPLIDGSIIAVFDDVIIIEKNSQVILINKAGKILLETKKKHKFIGAYNDNLLKLQDEHWKDYFVDHQGNNVEVEDNITYKDRKIEEKGYGKYTLIDTITNKVLVPVGRYSSIEKFNQFNLAEVEKDYKKGFIDLNGREVVPCIYNALRVLDMGYIAFKTQQRLWGLMDKNGKIVLKAQYDDIKNYTAFSKDIAIIRLDNREGILGKNLTEIIPPKYQDIDLVDKTTDLLELQLNRKKKIVNREFKELFPNQDYDSIEGHYKFKNFLEVRKGKLYGLFDKEGKEIVPVKYSYIDQIDATNDTNSTSNTRHTEFIKVIGEKGKGVYDTNGKMIIPAIYKRLWYSHPMFFYELNNYDKGRMDLAGNKINLAKYESGFIVTDNVLAMKKGKNWGLIDNKKNTLLDFDYASMRYLSNDKLLFRKRAFWGFGKISDWGVMDLKGNVITEPSFTIFKSVNRSLLPDNLLAISKANSFNVGFLSKETGKIAIKFQYNELLNGFTEKEQQYLFVSSNDGAGVLNLTRQKEIVPAKYDDIKMLDNGFFKAYKGSIWSVYDPNGIKIYEKEKP